MARLKVAREGELLRVRELKVQYSLWPAKKTTRWKLQRRLYVRDPWAILSEAVYRNKSSFPTSKPREEALSYLDQAEEYYKAGIQGWRSVKPTLMYYSMLNLAKCLIKARSPQVDMSQARHGLVAMAIKERAILGDRIAVKSSTKYTNVFPELMRALERRGPSFQTLEVRDLLPQILPGHRLWTYACGKTERFLAVSDVECYVDTTRRSLWLRLKFDRGEVRHILPTVQALIQRSHLPGRWNQVRVEGGDGGDDKAIVLEQERMVGYKQRPTDSLQDLFQSLRPALWYTVTSTPSHRKYYLFVDSQLGKKRLPQWAAMYALFFYLSDLTRYRPQLFDRVVQSKYGPQVECVLDECPQQFLYLMASELLQRDVAPAAIA